MSNIINKIRLSGTDYTLSATTSGGVTSGEVETMISAATSGYTARFAEDEEVTAAALNDLNERISGISGNNVVELTQAEYDALVSGGTVDPTAFYIITDAVAFDPSTKVDTSAITSSVTSASTNSEIPTAKAVYDAVGGGGKAIEAGRGISVASGTSAYTVSFNLPISAGTGSNSVAEGYNTKASGVCSHAEGEQTSATSEASHAEGYKTKASGNFGSHAEGRGTTANGDVSHAEGFSTKASGIYSHAEGRNTTANNQSEHASGQYNVSVSASTTFGNSGNTLFSVGNGTSDIARHNAFEIRQNGDIYLSLNGQDVKLQDQLGGGGTVDQTIISGSTNAVAGGAVYDKFDEVEQVTARALNELNDAVSGKVDTSTFDTYSGNVETALSGKQDTLSAGTGIDITDNVISATGGGGGGKAVSGGTNISITTGETADTINCTLPMSTDSLKKIVVDSNYSSFVTSNAVITANSLSNNILIGNNTFKIKGIVKGKINNNLIIGSYNTSELTNGTSPTLEGNLVVGSNNQINSNYSLLVGSNSTISRGYQFAIGYKQQPKNEYEISLGAYNVSSSGSSTFGDSGNTLFSVGNGTAENARHNAFEIRQNGDIYLTLNGQDVKLQDQLGGGGGITSGEVQTMIDESVSGKTNQNDNLFTIRTNVIETVVIAGGTNLRIIFAFDIIQNNQIVLSTDTVNDKSSLLSALATLGFDNKIYDIRGVNYTDDTSLTSYFGEFLGHKCYAVLLGYVPDFGSTTIGLKRNNVYYTLDSVGSGKYNYNYLSNKPSITTSITSASTDSEIPSAKAVNDKLGGLSLVKLTQSEYDSLATKDNSTLYVIVN